MIEFIRIKNFKSLLNNQVQLGYLNLFSGLNSMGKSTFIQSLLLLRQSFMQGVLDKGLLLNGDYLNVGVGKDAFAMSANTEQIEFLLRLKNVDEKLLFRFDYKSDTDLQPLSNSLANVDLNKFSLFNANFQYLNANRVEPKSHHLLSNYNIKELNNLGKNGEYTVHFIAENGSKPLSIIELKHKQARSGDLLSNIEAWMSDISPGVRLKAVARPEFNTATLSYAFEQGSEVTDDFKPQNVGFGLSYVLPVVTAILSAARGDLLLIENPESHLHPAGQGIMGKLCALAAQNGVQMIIESHSDHFLNGVRVAVKQKIIDVNNVKIFFLQRDIQNNNHASEIITPTLNERGQIDIWADGFFDEWDKQLGQLL